MKRGFILLIFLIMIFFVSGCASQKSSVTTPNDLPSEPPIPPVGQPLTQQFSEQLDSAVFNEYFSDFFLGKRPSGTKSDPTNIPRRTKVFTSGDQFCPVWNQMKVIPLAKFATAVYDKDAKNYTRKKSVLPIELINGSHAICEDLTFVQGEYEYKVYVNNVLAAVLPFEVR